jgi:hypothetical protein
VADAVLDIARDGEEQVVRGALGFEMREIGDFDGREAAAAAGIGDVVLDGCGGFWPVAEGDVGQAGGDLGRQALEDPAAVGGDDVDRAHARPGAAG